MIDNMVQWATLLSPIISVIAIIVALHVARSSMEVDIVYPFVGGARIDHIIAAQEKAKQKAHLDQLLAKRREIEVNLSLIQDYVKKATR